MKLQPSVFSLNSQMESHYAGFLTFQLFQIFKERLKSFSRALTFEITFTIFIEWNYYHSVFANILKFSVLHANKYYIKYWNYIFCDQPCETYFLNVCTCVMCRV